MSAALAKRIPRGELVLLDVQPKMLDKAKHKLNSMGFQNVRYLPADVSDGLPYADGYFDLVLLVCVLGEIPDQRACPRVLRRVLRSGGDARYS